MKPKIILTVACVLLFLMSFASVFMLGDGFNWLGYLAIGFTLCFAILFWSVRNAPPSGALNAVLFTGFLAFFLGSLLAFYAQWSGTYMESPLGYLEGVAWLAMAVWFFFVWRGNRSASAG